MVNGFFHLGGPSSCTVPVSRRSPVIIIINITNVERVLLWNNFLPGNSIPSESSEGREGLDRCAHAGRGARRQGQGRRQGREGNPAGDHERDEDGNGRPVARCRGRQEHLRRKGNEIRGRRPSHGYRINLPLICDRTRNYFTNLALLIILIPAAFEY